MWWGHDCTSPRGRAFHPKAVVVGVRLGDDALAIPKYQSAATRFARAQLAPGFGPRYLTDVFNPTFVLTLSDAVVLAVPVPVLAAALVLGLLVGANMAPTVEAIATRPPGCGIARP
ncbi:MAG: hypothetical protein EXR61_03895 [Chloroflexi bacterium]|nr:hypothetical protein [Chloroflexota bacterium]